MKIIKFIVVLLALSIAPSLTAMDPPPYPESDESDEKVDCNNGPSDFDEAFEQVDNEELPPSLDVQPANPEPTARARRARRPCATVLALQNQSEVEEMAERLANLILEDGNCLACCWPKDNCTCMQVSDFMTSIHAPCMACSEIQCICYPAQNNS